MIELALRLQVPTDEQYRSAMEIYRMRPCASKTCSTRKSRQGFPRRLVPLRFAERCAPSSDARTRCLFLLGRTTSIEAANALPICRANDPRPRVSVTGADGVQASAAALNVWIEGHKPAGWLLSRLRSGRVHFRTRCSVGTLHDPPCCLRRIDLETRSHPGVSDEQK